MPKFTIKNPKKFFKAQPILTVQECLQLLPNLSQYSYDDYQEGFNRKAFLEDSLDNVGNLWLGIEGQSASGFSLVFLPKQQVYEIYVDFFALSVDWQLAQAYLIALSQTLGQPIKDENGQVVLGDMDYLPILESNLRGLFDIACKEEQTLVYLKRSVVFGVKMVEKLTYMGNPLVEAYEKLVLSAQYPKAHIHEQTFHLNPGNKTIYGNYTYGEDLEQILPCRPFIEHQFSRVTLGHPLTHWTLSIAYHNGEKGEQSYSTVGTYPYETAIQCLMTYPYESLDENFIVIKPLNREQLEEIVSSLESDEIV